MRTVNTIAIAIAASGILLMAADMSSKDKMFATKAAEGGMAEVQLGHLATEKASSQKVKDFGMKMATDHGKAGDKLKSIASSDNISLPSDVSAKDKALMKRLSSLSGSAFDKAYMSAMVKDHEMDVADFQKEADGGMNSDLKGFASSTLPTLREHLNLAKETASSVGAE